VPATDSDSGLNCPGCRKLRALLDEALERLAAAEKRIEELEREGHRQAAPFRRPEKKRKQVKAKPGRKKGHKPSYRKPPPVVDDAAEVPLDRCPDCGGPVHDVRPVKQIIEDIPQVKVHRLHLTTYRGRCDHCGPVCSTHPQQVSRAVGAAGTHVGRNALALAADLNKHYGLTMRKTCAILREHFGLRLTPGGLSQALTRIAGKLQRPFDELVEQLRQAPAVHADETSWWLGGQSAWLWVFTNPALTLYTIGNRSQHVIRRILGDDFLGVLISDCLASYDPHPGPKSKCCAHHLKAIGEALKQAPDSEFLHELRLLLKAAITLHRVREDVPGERYWGAVARLDRRLDEMLERPRGHPEEIRIRNRLTKHRPHLLTFLHVAGVDPTNNLAERQLRPAVIARKLSCGNKTEAGKATFEVLASLAATCRQQGRSFTDLVAAWLSLGLPPPPLFDPD
jgi:hypothetical protein